MRRIWVDGSLRDWDEAKVHVWDEVAIRGVSAFEGILCVWRRSGGKHVVIAGGKHFRRLQRSASIIDVPMAFSKSQLDDVLREASIEYVGQNFYARPTVYVKKGRSSAAKDLELGWFLGAFPVDLVEQVDVAKAAIIWPSRSGSIVPPDAKTGGSYLDFRIVDQKRQMMGADVGIVVDPFGNMVEADGSGLLVVDDEEVIVPDVSGHALDSITRRILIELARREGFALRRGNAHWSQAHGSVLVLAGTLSGVKLATLKESLMEPSSLDLKIATTLRHKYYSLLADDSVEGWLAEAVQS